MCINIKRHQRPVIIKEKIMMAKTRQKQRRQVSLHQGLIPNHGPQDVAVRCATHVNVYNPCKPAKIKPRNIYAIP